MSEKEKENLIERIKLNWDFPICDFMILEVKK